MVVAGIVAALPSPSDAVLVCGRKNKVTLRASACKKKETLVQDLGKVATDLGNQTGRLDDIGGDLFATCKDGSLTRIEPTAPLLMANTNQGDLGSVCSGPCRAFDGNQSGCESAYTATTAGVTSCFYLDGLCRPCKGCGERRGACTNKCSDLYPGVTCGDAARTHFAGGPGTEACYRLRTQALCESSWHSGRDGRATSCAWGGSSCFGCSVRNEKNSGCTNTCAAAPVTCKDATRVNTSRCSNFNGNQASCETAWHATGFEGIAASCYWDAANNRCRGCGLKHEFPGNCTNTCL